MYALATMTLLIQTVTTYQTAVTFVQVLMITWMLMAILYPMDATFALEAMIRWTAMATTYPTDVTSAQEAMIT